MIDKIKILIADDHRIVLDGLKAIINGHEEFELIADVTDGKQALDIALNINIDVALLDIDMPVLNGIETTKILHKEKPDIKVLILSMHHEKNLIRNLLNCGACGYVLKNSSTEELVHAIKTVYKGNTYLDKDVQELLSGKEMKYKSDFANEDGLAELTNRELEILKLIAEGNSNKQIGGQINISHRTVDTHRTNIMKKIGVNNIAGIIRFAIQKGISS